MNTGIYKKWDRDALQSGFMVKSLDLNYSLGERPTDYPYIPERPSSREKGSLYKAYHYK